MNIYLIIACFLPAIGLVLYAAIDVIASHIESLHNSVKEYKAWKKWNEDYWLDE